MSTAASARLPKTPAEDVQPKARHLSIANLESEMWTTVPGHWDCLIGMVRYASAISWTATCDPGGRWCMVLLMVSKVPQVQGKCEEVMSTLMEQKP